MLSKEDHSKLQDHVSAIFSSLQRKDSFDENTEYLASDACTYEKYSFKATKDQPFLQSMLPSKNEVFILVYANKKLHQSSENESNNTLSLTESEQTNKLPSLADELGLDVVVGRPLECPFGADDPGLECSVFDDKTVVKSVALSPFPPLTEAEALIILGIFREVMKLEAINNPNALFPPIAVFCDGKDRMGTIIIGLHRISKILERFRITCKDSLYTAKEVPSIESLRKSHHLGGPSNVVSRDAKAKYIIFESAGESYCGSKAKSNVVLHCEWKNARQVLETPSSDALCTIFFNVFLGDSQTMLKSKWEELAILERIIQALDSNDSSWASSNSEITVLEKVKNLLEGMQTVEVRKNTTSSRKFADQSQAENFFMKESLSSNRQNLDFSDKLWTVLKDCSSRDELKDCLKMVLATFQSEEFKHIKLGKSTALGKIVNDVYRRNSEISNLDALNPLSLLVEMGIEKLKQDYIFLFLISGLATKDILSPFMKSSSCEFNESFKCLKKLHCVTELIALCCVSVSNDYPLVSTYARMALNQVATVPFNLNSHSFSFQIDRQSVLKDFKAGSNPYEWQLGLKWVQDECVSYCTFLFTTMHPFEQFGTRSYALSGELCSDQMYYLCQSSTVQNKAELGNLKMPP